MAAVLGPRFHRLDYLFGDTPTSRFPGVPAAIAHVQRQDDRICLDLVPVRPVQIPPSESISLLYRVPPFRPATLAPRRDVTRTTTHAWTGQASLDWRVKLAGQLDPICSRRPTSGVLQTHHQEDPLIPLWGATSPGRTGFHEGRNRYDIDDLSEG
jgi:hypothetical protein